MLRKRIAAIVGSIVGLALLFPVLSPLPVRAQEAPIDLDGLFELFNVGDVSADFVVVVDTSGSMSEEPNPPYPGVLQAYAALIDAIPDGDFVAVITFDKTSTLEFNDVLNSSSRNHALKALPPTADGRNTDIGAALDATIERLERADSSDVQTVIFLTDGKHEPDDNSQYPGKSGPAWDRLKERAADVDATHDLTVLGIGLAEGTDIDLVRSVFPSTEVNNLSPEQLPAFFEEAVRRSQVARLRTLVNEELEKGAVRISGATDAELSPVIETTVSLSSSFAKLPVTVRVNDAAAVDDKGRGIPVSVGGSMTFSIQPGQTVEVPVTLRPDLDSERFTVPEVTEQLRAFIELDAIYTVEPANVLDTVTPESLNGVVGGSATVTTTRTFGWSIRRLATVALAVLVVLLILWSLYRRYLQRPRLTGFFTLSGPGVVDGKEILRLRGKTMLLNAGNVPGAGSAEVKLYTRRGHRGHIYADVERPTFKTVRSRTSEKTVPDTTEIRFGKYKLGTCVMQFTDKAPAGQTRKRKQRRDDGN